MLHLEVLFPLRIFFSDLIDIINVVDGSAKRHDQLRIAQAIRIDEMIRADEIRTGRGKNQLQSLQRPSDTRWSSCLNSTNSLLQLFDPTLVVLEEISNDASNSSRGIADRKYDMMKSFQFVFMLHFLHELLGMTSDLCRMLQNKSQDILNAMSAVSNTKEVVQKFREDGWEALLEKVKMFCAAHGIEIVDMNGLRRSVKGRARANSVTLGHYYRVELFNGTIDCMLQEMNFRFNEDALELLRLSSSFDPRGDYKLFVVDDICKLVEKFYPEGFTSEEKTHLRFQLGLFKVDIQKNTELHVSTLSELCTVLTRTCKSSSYFLVDRLIRLLLTLPVSTASSERAFSAMKIVKTRLRSSMEDDFLSSNLIMHIEKEIVEGFDIDSTIDDFEKRKRRRIRFS